LEVFEGSCWKNTIGDLYLLLDLGFEGDDKIVSVYFKEFYGEVKEFKDKHEVWIIETNTRKI
jgi:hypothetical protein